MDARFDMTVRIELQVQWRHEICYIRIDECYPGYDCKVPNCCASLQLRVTSCIISVRGLHYLYCIVANNILSYSHEKHCTASHLCQPALCHSVSALFGEDIPNTTSKVTTVWRRVACIILDCNLVWLLAVVVTVVRSKHGLEERHIEFKRH
jgi:hypothetical protein